MLCKSKPHLHILDTKAAYNSSIPYHYSSHNDNEIRLSHELPQIYSSSTLKNDSTLYDVCHPERKISNDMRRLVVSLNMNEKVQGTYAPNINQRSRLKINELVRKKKMSLRLKKSINISNNNISLREKRAEKEDPIIHSLRDQQLEKQSNRALNFTHKNKGKLCEKAKQRLGSWQLQQILAALKQSENPFYPRNKIIRTKSSLSPPLQKQIDCPEENQMDSPCYVLRRNLRANSNRQINLSHNHINLPPKKSSKGSDNKITVNAHRIFKIGTPQKSQYQGKHRKVMTEERIDEKDDEYGPWEYEAENLLSPTVHQKTQN